jgi:hypothetical protein
LLTPCARPDGFLLTEWGEWRAARVAPALERAIAAGARHVTLIAEMAQAESPDADPRWAFSDAAEPFENGLQAARLREIASALTQRGVEVGLVPILLWKGGRRQWLRPRRLADWFARYAVMMDELASFADSVGASELVVGSELTRLFPHADAWRSIIARVRARFYGHLTLCPTALDYATIRLWDALDSVGVSAYFPLSPTRVVRARRALEASWWVHRGHIEMVAKLWQKPITFVEVGYPSTEVAATRPWDYRFEVRRVDLELQDACWRAFASVWEDARSLRAFRIWGLAARSDAGGKTHSPLEKPAEATVSALFSRRR